MMRLMVSTASRVCNVEKTGFGGVQRGANGFQVAHFANQDGVRVLAKTGAQGGGEGGSIHFHFALVHESFLVAMQKFNRVFNRDDVLRAQ